MLRLIVAALIIYIIVSCKENEKNGIPQVDNTTYPLTYDQLREYPKQCDLATQQLKQLRNIQRTKNFDPDPDKLNETDRAYNSVLKATIWWFAYTCNKS